MKRAAKFALAFALMVVAYPLVLAGRTALEFLCPLWLWSAEIHGRVIDERGQPVAGAQVVAEYFGRREGMIPGSRSPALTDARGEFVLQSVPGPVTLFARKDGLMSQPFDLELQNGQELPGVALSLDPGGTIEVECVDAAGTPQPDRWIAVEQADYHHWWDEDRIANVRTGPAGSFHCEGVPSGEMRVMLGARYPFQQEQVVTVERGQTSRVRFTVPGAPR